MAQPQGNVIQIDQLPIDQLVQLSKQIEEELELMINSYGSLTHAANSFQESNEAMDDFTPQNEGKEVFMPLTSSLYVHGTLTNTKDVLVDIGTGYYVEKSTPAAKDYLTRREQAIRAKAAEIEEKIEAKRKNQVQLQMVLQAKLSHVKQQARQ